MKNYIYVIPIIIFINSTIVLGQITIVHERYLTNQISNSINSNKFEKANKQLDKLKNLYIKSYLKYQLYKNSNNKNKSLRMAHSSLLESFVNYKNTNKLVDPSKKNYTYYCKKIGFCFEKQEFYLSKLENEILLSAEETDSSLTSFINDYPNSTHITKVTEKLYELRFKQAKKENTIYAYNHFIESNPKASQINEAIKLKQEAAFYQAMNSNNENEIRDYIANYKFSQNEVQLLVEKLKSTILNSFLYDMNQFLILSKPDIDNYLQSNGIGWNTNHQDYLNKKLDPAFLNIIKGNKKISVFDEINRYKINYARFEKEFPESQELLKINNEFEKIRKLAFDIEFKVLENINNTTKDYETYINRLNIIKTKYPHHTQKLILDERIRQTTVLLQEEQKNRFELIDNNTNQLTAKFSNMVNNFQNDRNKDNALNKWKVNIVLNCSSLLSCTEITYQEHKFNMLSIFNNILIQIEDFKESYPNSNYLKQVNNLTSKLKSMSFEIDYVTAQMYSNKFGSKYALQNGKLVWDWFFEKYPLDQYLSDNQMVNLNKLLAEAKSEISTIETNNDNSVKPSPDISENSQNLFDQIPEHLIPYFSKYSSKDLSDFIYFTTKINEDPLKKDNKTCGKSYSPCKWCERSIQYTTYYKSRISKIKSFTKPLFGEYLTIISNINPATKITKMMTGKSDKIGVEYDILEQMNFIRKKNYYECSGRPQDFCSLKCQNEYRNYTINLNR